MIYRVSGRNYSQTKYDEGICTAIICRGTLFTIHHQHQSTTPGGGKGMRATRKCVSKDQSAERERRKSKAANNKRKRKRPLLSFTSILVVVVDPADFGPFLHHPLPLCPFRSYFMISLKFMAPSSNFHTLQKMRANI